MMISEYKTLNLERAFNVLLALGFIIALIVAFILQFFNYELPCPTCVMERIGMGLIIFGFLMNLRFGIRRIHYGLSILMAFFTGIINLRHIGLHIIPGTGSDGGPLFGMHLYTWGFLASSLTVVVVGLVLSLSNRQYPPASPQNMCWPRLTHTLFAIATLLILMNLISLIIECGPLSLCPEDPIRYLL